MAPRSGGAAAAANGSGTVVQPGRHGRAARQRIDKRVALGRRVKELIAVFSQKLGADTADLVLAAEIQRAAERVALAEAARARSLRAAVWCRS
jgi:hypothetical protein